MRPRTGTTDFLSDWLTGFSGLQNRALERDIDEWTEQQQLHGHMTRGEGSQEEVRGEPYPR
jgi:hypothetical protein